jgi:hypothetical protein
LLPVAAGAVAEPLAFGGAELQPKRIVTMAIAQPVA